MQSMYCYGWWIKYFTNFFTYEVNCFCSSSGGKPHTLKDFRVVLAVAAFESFYILCHLTDWKPLYHPLLLFQIYVSFSKHAYICLNLKFSVNFLYVHIGSGYLDFHMDVKDNFSNIVKISIFLEQILSNLFLSFSLIKMTLKGYLKQNRTWRIWKDNWMMISLLVLLLRSALQWTR
jgi:hypothetical protein